MMYIDEYHLEKSITIFLLIYEKVSLSNKNNSHNQKVKLLFEVSLCIPVLND